MLIPSPSCSGISTEPGSSDTYSLFSSLSLPLSNVNSTTNPNSYHVHVPQGKDINSYMFQSNVPRVQFLETMETLDAVLGPFPLVRVRGLPFEASLEDVLVFFQGLVVLDVVVVSHSYGQGSDEAFVVFANPMDFQMALQRDRQTIGHRFIEVFQGKRSDYYAAIAMQFKSRTQLVNQIGDGESTNSREQNSNGNAWVGLNSTPSQVLKTSIVQKDSDVGPGIYNINGGASSSSSKGHGGLTSNRSGRVPADSRSRGNTAGRSSGRGGGIQVGDHTGYLRMRGLPFTSTKKEIYEFFKMYDPIEDSITLTYRSDGRATGEGYIAFNSSDSAKNAMVLHRNTMGSRYIELFISNKEEHTRSVVRESNAR